MVAHLFKWLEFIIFAFVKKLISLLFVFLSIQLSAQTIDTFLLINKTDSTVIDIPISKIDSITFRYDTILISYRISGKVLDSLKDIADMTIEIDKVDGFASVNQ